jgi:hypothetical protein
MAETDTGELLRGALHVVNEVMDAYRDRMPYAQLLKLGDTVLSGYNIDVLVHHEDDPCETLACFTMQLRKGAFELVSADGEPSYSEWRVSRGDLARLIRHPKEYIEHPSRLDWAWLRSRVGPDIHAG